MRHMRALVGVVLVINVWGFAAGCGGALAESDPHASLEKTAAPLDGWRVEEGRMGESLAIPAPGMITVVDFWATTCAPCRERVMPELEALWQRVDRSRVAIVGVAIDNEGENLDALVRKALAEDVHVTFPVVLDGKAGNLGAAYGVRGLVPATFVIDRRGAVRFYFDGSEGDGARLEAAVKALLREGT